MTPAVTLTRCDRCGKTAVHRAARGASELLLCQQHFEQHRIKLQDQHWLFEWIGDKPVQELLP